MAWRRDAVAPVGCAGSACLLDIVLRFCYPKDSIEQLHRDEILVVAVNRYG
jgi:hypothetical protein